MDHLYQELKRLKRQVRRVRWTPSKERKSRGGTYRASLAISPQVVVG